jgi:outer membrane receptor protein involved in Fe transport
VEAPGKPLHPETMVSHELVFERGFSSWSQISVDGAYNKLQDLIDQAPDPSNGRSHFVNIGRDKGRAVEVEMEAKRISGLAARASYKLQESMNGIQQVRLANAPLQMAKFHGLLPLPHRAFGGLELLYSSAQRTYQGTQVPSSLITNAALSARHVLGGFEFSASLYNAFDYRWYSPAGPELRQAEIQQDRRAFLFKLSRTISYKRASR